MRRRIDTLRRSPALLLGLVPLVGLATVVGGCRTTADVVAPPGHALCPVCRCEGDLGCVLVEIEPDTPTLEIDGRTLCFCSESCRVEYAAHPERYPDAN